jgi:G3E family GTPase
MADPLPIIRTLCNTPQIARVFGLNGIVTLVDAKNALHRLREVDESDVEREEAEEAAALAGTGPLPPDEAFQQIMFADRVVLSKVDLVDTATAIEVRSRMDLGWISDGSRMDLLGH